MKQVRLWIAVCPFSGELYLHYMYNKHKYEAFCKDILKKVQKKCERFRPKHNYFTMSCVGILKDNESFSTVLQALWELQKSLLPGNIDIDNANNLNSEITIYHKNTGKKWVTSFYDPATGIITITEFGGEG